MKSSIKKACAPCGITMLLATASLTVATAQTPVWTNSYNGPGNSNDRANAMAVDAVGNVVVTGYSYGNGTGYDYATIKYSSAGLPLWTNLYNGPGNNTDDPLAVAFDVNGNVLVAGYSYGSGTGFDYAILKYSSAGVPLWTNRYNGPVNGDDESYAVATDTNGNVFVTGTANINATGLSGEDITTIKYSSAGAQLWLNTYNGPGDGEDGGTAIAVDGNGDVVLTGSSTGSDGSFNYVTIKYSNAGAALWTNRYEGPAGAGDQPYAIAVDSSNSVVVTGYSIGNGTGKDYATIKYSSTGILLWTNRYDGTGSGDDIGFRLAVDRDGDVIVTGYSTGNGSGYDYATIKYSPAGVPLWTNLYNGAANGDDYALSVAVDASGGALVTGYSTGSATGKDYATIKYSSGGTALWTNYFNGAGNADDSGYVVASDGYGNVVVTGYAAGNGSGSDYVTLKLHDDTAPAPVLAFSLKQSNAFVVSWPSALTGFGLQTTTNLETGNWDAATEPLVDDSTNKSVILNSSPTNHFYRLKGP